MCIRDRCRRRGIRLAPAYHPGVLGRRPPVAAPSAMALLVVAMVVIGCATPVDSAASPGSAPASGVAPPAEPSASAPTGPFRPSLAPSPNFASYVDAVRRVRGGVGVE